MERIWNFIFGDLFGQGLVSYIFSSLLYYPLPPPSIHMLGWEPVREDTWSARVSSWGIPNGVTAGDHLAALALSCVCHRHRSIRNCGQCSSQVKKYKIDTFTVCMKTNHDLSLLSVWYLTFYCDPRLTEIVVVKILMEGISTTAVLYKGLFIRAW